MIITFLTRYSVKNIIEPVNLNFMALFFIFRMAHPYFKYFYIVFLILSIIQSYKYKNILKSEFIYFCNEFKLVIFNLLILLIAFSFSIPTFFMLKEIINAGLLFITFFLFFSILIILIVFISSIISYFIIKDLIFVDYFYNNLDYQIDYNFQTIPLFFSLVIISFSMVKYNFSVIIKSVLYLFWIIFTASILISSSRRGLFLLIFLTILTIPVQFYLFSSKNKMSYNKFVFLRYYSVLFIFVILLIGFYKSSFEVKNKFIEIMGSKYVSATKFNISLKLYRIYFIINKDSELWDFHKNLWSQKFDPIDPGSGWGRNHHKLSFPLEGVNVEMIPHRAKGYLLDSTTGFYTYEGNSYSNTLSQEFVVQENDTIEASIYCYASNNFNADWVFFGLFQDSLSIFTKQSYYNLENKGVWQKLYLKAPVEKGKVSLWLYFAKLKNQNFDSLNGHVIFAYPDYEVIKQPNLKRKGLSESSVLSILSGISSNISAQLLNNKIFIKRLTNKYLNDTTYISYKEDLNTDYQIDKFGDDRLNRWKFAVDIWTKEYNLIKKIFGGGFNFLKWYGKVFQGDHKRLDYPHNPFLHVLLYSGIIGLAFYSFLLVQSIKLYWKYRTKYPFFGIFFLITFFFTIFGGGDPFSPPIMGFFMLLPFLIHAIQQAEKEKKLN